MLLFSIQKQQAVNGERPALNLEKAPKKYHKTVLALFSKSLEIFKLYRYLSPYSEKCQAAVVQV